MDVSKDYYKILGVNKNAAKKDIRSSYLKLAKKWHPDLHKKDKDKENARNKFIEFQEAYEVLYDDGMRKKYDEMRRYGVTQEQYKYREAYSRQQQQPQQRQPPGYSSPYETEWERDFRRQMGMEWEKIRRDQQDWASQRRKERHQYSSEFPFGTQANRKDYGPFGPFAFGGAGGPGGGSFNSNRSPAEGFFRTVISVMLFVMIFRAIGVLLFGGGRRRGDPNDPYYYDPYDRSAGSGKGYPPGYRPGSYPSERDYNRYNQNFPPPLSLREKSDHSDNQRRRGRVGTRELNRDVNDRHGPFVPPPPPPRPRERMNDKTSLNQKQYEEDDGSKFVYTAPSSQQTTDISSPMDQRRRERKANSKQTRYERMIEEQKMMEELYIKARKKQQQQAEFRRQQEFDKKFGLKSRTPPPSSHTSDDNEDPNEAWERYLNSKRKTNSRNTRWDDRD